MNIVLLVVYILLSTVGATLIKWGGDPKWKSFFNVPFFDVHISFVSLSGILSYGLSFLIFIVLLNKLDLSYLTPVATGASYALLILSSVIVFHESFTVIKAVGCLIILFGILLVATNSSTV